MFTPSEMSLDFVKSLFTPERLRPVKKILLCGGEGDPIYCKDFLKIIEFLKNEKPDVFLSIITNGSYKDVVWWRQLGNLLNSNDAITFSIDGWDQSSNEMYRVNSNWNSIIEGIASIQPTDALLNWSTILFSFNQNKINDIRSLAKSLGLDAHTIVYSNLFGSRIRRYLDPKTNIDPLEPDNDFRNISGMHIKNFERLSEKSWNCDSFTSTFKEKTDEINQQTKGWYVTPLCKTGHRALYVNAEGYLYPCSWVSHPYEGVVESRQRLGVTAAWKDTHFIKNREKFNLKENDIEKVLSDKFCMDGEDLWRTSENTPLVCEKKCRRSTETTRG